MDTSVAIIGAGPYGLSIAAHLRARGVPFRIFGEPMSFWREMPPRMFLKSLASATSIAMPDGGNLFPDWSRARGLEAEEPCAIADFSTYGVDVQKVAVPEVEQVLATRVVRSKDGYQITLTTGETFSAGSVIVAVGLKTFARIPAELAGFSAEHVSHTCHHSTFETFRGKKVAVVGAGQSALQAAALLHECGASVEVFVRKSAIDFSVRTEGKRSLIDRIRWPKSGLGVGHKNWLLDSFPGVLRMVPDRWRVPFVKTHLGPSVAWWLRERVTGKFPVHVNSAVTSAELRDGRLALKVGDKAGEREAVFDHIVAGTGFEMNIDRLAFLDAGIRSQLARIERSVRLDGNFQSSVPGLHFVGTVSAMSFGPLFRFVAGARYTARILSRHLAAHARAPIAKPASVEMDTAEAKRFASAAR
jgi:pyruvate/2-oxoglutarate dehydrogenase complex dihydrolipoamide dehydrogenase (E3) component